MAFLFISTKIIVENTIGKLCRNPRKLGYIDNYDFNSKYRVLRCKRKNPFGFRRLK